MDIDDFTLKELLIAAINSEEESKEIYEKAADRVKNALLKERLRFLASEEEKHRVILENIYRMHFGDEEKDTTISAEIPLPKIEIDSENDPISLVLESAMKVERETEEFYRKLAERFDERKIHNMLVVLSEMEHTHYQILKTECENLKRFEEYDAIWPMMHVGP